MPQLGVRKEGAIAVAVAPKVRTMAVAITTADRKATRLMRMVESLKWIMSDAGYGLFPVAMLTLE